MIYTPGSSSGRPAGPLRLLRAAARRSGRGGRARPRRRVGRRAPRPRGPRRGPREVARLRVPRGLRGRALAGREDRDARVPPRDGLVAAVREGRGAPARDVHPGEGPAGPRPRAQWTPRLARDRRVPAGRAPRRRADARGARRRKGPPLDRLDRAPRRRRARLRRRDASRAGQGVDADASGQPRTPRARLRRRDLRLLPALRRAADEEAAPDAPQAGARLRRRRRPRVAEPRRPRLPRPRELRLLVGRDAADRERPCPTRGRTRGSGRHGRVEAPGQDAQARLPPPRRPPQGAGPRRDALGDELPPRPDDEGRPREAARVRLRPPRRPRPRPPPRARPRCRPSGPRAGSRSAGPTSPRRRST